MKQTITFKKKNLTQHFELPKKKKKKEKATDILTVDFDFA